MLQCFQRTQPSGRVDHVVNDRLLTTESPTRFLATLLTPVKTLLPSPIAATAISRLQIVDKNGNIINISENDPPTES
jgi:hypothetical protein